MKKVVFAALSTAMLVAAPPSDTNSSKKSPIGEGSVCASKIADAIRKKIDDGRGGNAIIKHMKAQAEGCRHYLSGLSTPESAIAMLTVVDANMLAAAVAGTAKELPSEAGKLLTVEKACTLTVRSGIPLVISAVLLKSAEFGEEPLMRVAKSIASTFREVDTKAAAVIEIVAAELAANVRKRSTGPVVEKEE